MQVFETVVPSESSDLVVQLTEGYIALPAPSLPSSAIIYVQDLESSVHAVADSMETFARLNTKSIKLFMLDHDESHADRSVLTLDGIESLRACFCVSILQL